MNIIIINILIMIIINVIITYIFVLPSIIFDIRCHWLLFILIPISASNDDNDDKNSTDITAAAIIVYLIRMILLLVDLARSSMQINCRWRRPSTWPTTTPMLWPSRMMSCRYALQQWYCYYCYTFLDYYHLNVVNVICLFSW